MKTNTFLSLNKVKNIITLVIFISVCLFMQNFYKITLGWVANNFEGGMLLPTISIAYFVPILCFFFYFFNYYVKRINKIVSAIYSIVIIGLSTFVLINIFNNISIYVSNNSLGVYQTLPSILFGFPYDGIIVHILLILIQVVNLISVIKPNHKIALLKEKFYSLDYLKIRIGDYVVLVVVTLLSCLFAGLFVCGLSAFSNVFHDIKYLYLLVWYLLPVINLVCIVFRVENDFQTDKGKIKYLAYFIIINIVFMASYFLFEIIHPNFIVQIGKPLLPITFSISMRIELMLLIGVQSVGILIYLIKLLLIILRKNEKN